MKKKNTLAGQVLNRRDFLKASATSLTSLALPPLFFEMLKSQTAHAASFSPVLPKYRFIHIHFAGGAGIWNWVGGALASNISGSITDQVRAAHGLTNPLSTAGITQTMYGTSVLRPTGKGTSTTAGVSAFHNALYSVIKSSPANTENRLQLLSAATTSPDDAPANCLYGMLPAIGLAGLQGSITSGIGLFGGGSGNGTGQWVGNDTLQMIPATRIGNVLNSVFFSTVLAPYGAPLLGKLAETMQKLSTAQVKKLSGGQFGNTSGGVYDDMRRNVVSIFTPDNLNATLDANSQAVYGLTSTPSDNATLLASSDANLRTAHVVHSVMKGFAASGSLTANGFDYHGRNKNEQDATDTIAGLMVGKVLELSARLSPTSSDPGLFLMITQDGGNVGNPLFTASSDPATTSRFVGDRRELCSSLVFVLNPAGKTSPLKKFFGTLNANGSVNDKTVMGKDRMYSAMVFYSYLLLNGLSERADMVLAAAGFTDAEIAIVKDPANSLLVA